MKELMLGLRSVWLVFRTLVLAMVLMMRMDWILREGSLFYIHLPCEIRSTRVQAWKLQD